jgi:DNA-binding NarL/FixJ family response regulator
MFAQSAASPSATGNSGRFGVSIGDGHLAEAAMRSERTNGGRVLIVEDDRALAGLFTDVIATHCQRQGMRIDLCGPRELEPLHDNIGGADVVLCSCGAEDGTRFDVLRAILTVRSCAAVLVLIPADMPGLADEAIAAGASDVLLRAPGYLEQLPVAVRKTVARSRAAMAAEVRAATARRELVQIRCEVASLRAELEEASRRSLPPKDRATGTLPLPVVTRPHEFARAA